MEIVTEIPRLAPRPPDSHKGMFGRILIVGGSVGMSGAAVLAGRAALRAGAGLVRVAVPETVLPIVAAGEPCYITCPLPQDESGGMASRRDRCTQAGLAKRRRGLRAGLRHRGAQRTSCWPSSQTPACALVIDADGLNNLAGTPQRPQRAKQRDSHAASRRDQAALRGLFREQMPRTGSRLQRHWPRHRLHGGPQLPARSSPTRRACTSTRRATPAWQPPAPATS